MEAVDKTENFSELSAEDSMLPFEDSEILAVFTASGLDLPNNLEDCVVNEPLDDKDRGKLAADAASILMKILCGAGMARSDLLRVVQGLARMMTRGMMITLRRINLSATFIIPSTGFSWDG